MERLLCAPYAMTTTVVLAIAACCVGYFCGSVPTGLLVARSVAGVDLRTYASGNIGATNVARVCGWRWGLAVLLLDALKGAVPALLVPWIVGSWWPEKRLLAASDLPVLVGLSAILGHMFPVWLRFKGGKGGATGLGVGAVLVPKAVLVAASCYVVVVALTRYSSLGTLTGTAAYVGTYLYLTPEPFAREHRSVTAFLALAVVLIVYKHRHNIRRLMSGTEHRLDFGGKRS